MDFQGFQNILHPAIILVAIAALLLLSWASYRKFESIPSGVRWILISLRGLAFILILLLLLNSYFYSSQEIEISPKIAVFLDNSESIDINKGDYEGLNSYVQLLNELNFNGNEQTEIEFYSIGENVLPFSPDSLNATEIQTNLSAPINSILEMEEQIQATVVISDGIITYGRNPTMNAINSSIPIYTIAVGDTSDVKDISVSNVLTNTTGYTNTNHIIEAEITQTGFQDNTLTVSLLTGDEELQQKTITFETDDQLKNVEFELTLEEAGLKQYQIKAQPLVDEWTDTNNSRLFSIDVLDNRVKILHIAFEIHPDVKAIRSLIEQDESNELYTLTRIGNNRYVEEIPDEDEYNLIIVHGVPPNTATDFEFLSTLDNTPTIFFELSAQPKSEFKNIEQLLILNSNVRQVSQITLFPLLNRNEHPVLELPEVNLSDAPPLFSPLRSNLSAPQSTALYSLNYNGTETQFPVIAVLEQGNIRRAHVLPWGWFRMLQSTNENNKEFTAGLLSNLVSWTSSDPDDRKLRITPAKQVFSTTEAPLLNGSLRNERGTPESEGIIEVQVENNDGTNRTFNMNNAGSGNYRLDLPRLSEGLYRFTATARKGDRELETQTGEFLVSNSSSELANTTRNDELMRNIAQNSGGSFFTYDNISGFWDSLRTANVLESKIENVENYSFPVHSLYWFVLVVLLLGSEWMLRKYYSLP
ncbi:MAG: hypothetical protein HUJ22_04280 [Gracilimonas sp.]|uniref:hypothetical protein n=1 Tax=Gracilimonas sp. TaxID=1974203 RepID=UPI00199789B1|nr:hypothetical protein [Gracilimonas sp.]MBD3615769.1 hypothetical protein [Gracilimonas sp.]